MSQYDYYRDGVKAGEEAAGHNIEHGPSRKELLEYIKADRVGEYAQGIREHQVQFAGDISYDVGDTVTERQYELWEEGFFKGFIAYVEAWHKGDLNIPIRKPGRRKK